MAPLPPPMEERKTSTGSISSTREHAESATYGSGGNRRPSPGSSFGVYSYNNYPGGVSSIGTVHPSSVLPSSGRQQQHQQQHHQQQHQPRGSRPRHNSHTGRSYLSTQEVIAQPPPLMAPNPPHSDSNPKRKNNSRDAGDSSGILSFLRPSSSRPPSPTLATDPLDSHSNSHTRKTSFGSRNLNPMNSSSTTLVEPSSTHHPSTYLPNPSSYSLNSVNTIVGRSGLNSYPSRPVHPFVQDTESNRRRSTESTYSRSSSPDPYQQRQNSTHGGNHQFPTSPPLPNRPHQTDTKGTTESVHRRTKSTDSGDMYIKRPGLPQELADFAASVSMGLGIPVPKESKKTTPFPFNINIFKKKSQHSGSSSQSSTHPPLERKLIHNISVHLTVSHSLPSRMFIDNFFLS